MLILQIIKPTILSSNLRNQKQKKNKCKTNRMKKIIKTKAEINEMHNRKKTIKKENETEAGIL